jgi:hypothetical protein
MTRRFRISPPLRRGDTGGFRILFSRLCDDQILQPILHAFGIRVLRFTNVEAHDHRAGAVEGNARALATARRTPLYPPFVRGERFKPVRRVVYGD